MPTHQAERANRTWLTGLLGAYILMQFGWWAYLLIQQHHTIDALAGSSTATRYTLMILGEGSVFLGLLSWGFVAIWKGIKKERAQARKERHFLLAVTHELKTPIFASQGYILTLLDGAMNDKAIRKKYLNRAEKGVERLIYIVKDLDMITKLEAGDLNLDVEEFDIIELVQSVFDLLEMKAAKQSISLAFDMNYAKPIIVKADKERIQQVLTNLIVNSIKYGRENGTTEISIENLIRNKVIVRVTDNGEGIEAENIPRLFERFYRVDKSRTRKEGGSGLGLSIVKHIIEAHNEKIYVESEYYRGSDFSVTFEKVE